MQLFTLGYEGISLSQFIQILRANAIETLVDVRQNAWSRKTGFAKAALGAACEAEGISYVHQVALGCPGAVRGAYRENGDWAQYTRDYRAYLATQREEISALHDRATTEICCLMCFEADFNLCHRSFVAEAVEKLGEIEIEHLNRNSIASASLVSV